MDNFFANNLKYIREKRGLSKSQLAEKLNVNQSTITRWENGEMGATVTNAFDISRILNISLPDLLGKDLSIDNASYIDIISNIVKIPVLGVIKAGTPIEAQEDIIEYVDIPEEWTKGNKKYYGLKIQGDSMYPKYEENDIVIFEQTEDYIRANKKDCAVMVNGDDATFKNVTITENGITLIPLNINNSDGYQPTFYDKEQIKNKPVRIIGIAKEKRTRL
jgi:repressor LexA